MNEPLAEDLEFLQHAGVKGMKWGVRKKADLSEATVNRKGRETRPGRTTGAQRKAGRNEVRATGQTAREIIREHRRATTKAGEKAAQDRYKKEVLQKIQSPEWKKSFQDANTMSKGETVMQVVGLGPFALLTIPAMQKGYQARRTEGYEFEVDMAHEVMREMKSA